MSTAKKITALSSEAIKARISSMIQARREYEKDVENIHVYISPGNKKTGLIPSVSLIPVADCLNCKSCAGSCYDLRHDCIYNGVKDTRARNSAIFRKDPDRYFNEISLYCSLYLPAFFRWHIGGDIPTRSYLDGMIKTAKENPRTTFLAYTKSNRISNAAKRAGVEIPENLVIVFSNWFNDILENPFNFATSNPQDIDGNTTANGAGFVCPGNCITCKACFKAVSGTEIIMPLH